MQPSSSDSISVLVVIGFCMAVGIAAIGAADYLSRLAQKRNLNLKPRVFQIFGFVIIACNLGQLLLLMHNPQSAASSVDVPDGQYTSDDGGYTIAFDGTPDEKTMQQQFGDISLVMHQDILRKDNPRWAYCVCYIDTGRELGIDEVEPSMLRTMAGTLGDPDVTKQITVDGAQGKEFIFRPAESFVRCRIFSHQHHIYAVLDGGPETQEDAYADLHFADSFHFTQ